MFRRFCHTAARAVFCDGHVPPFPQAKTITALEALKYVSMGRALIKTYKPSYGTESFDDTFEWPISRAAKALVAQKNWASMSESEKLLRAWVRLGPSKMYSLSETGGANYNEEDEDCYDHSKDKGGYADRMELAMVPEVFAHAFRVENYDGSQTPYLRSAAHADAMIRDKLDECGIWTTDDQEELDEELDLLRDSLYRIDWQRPCDRTVEEETEFAK